MQISLIITTYNQPQALILTLKSVENQSIKPNEIIIADDGSSVGTKNAIQDYKSNSDLRIIHSWQKDIGFRAAKSRNRAISLANFEYIVLIDGDMILHDKFIEDHIKHSKAGYFVQGSRVLISQAKTQEILLSKKIKISFKSRGIQNRKNAIHSSFFSFISSLIRINRKNINSIRSCNMGFYRKDCIEINGFNNSFEGWGREDSEFAVRLLNNGINKKTVRFSLIQYHLWHNESSRESLDRNTLMLEEAILKRSIWCDDGINRFL